MQVVHQLQTIIFSPNLYYGSQLEIGWKSHFHTNCNFHTMDILWKYSMHTLYGFSDTIANSIVWISLFFSSDIRVHEMPKFLMFILIHRTLTSPQYLYMNLWLELDNCLSVAELVRTLHRNRRAAGSNPARGQRQLHFRQLLLVRCNKCTSKTR